MVRSRASKYMVFIFLWMTTFSCFYLIAPWHFSSTRQYRVTNIKSMSYLLQWFCSKTFQNSPDFLLIGVYRHCGNPLTFRSRYVQYSTDIVTVAKDKLTEHNSKEKLNDFIVVEIPIILLRISASFTNSKYSSHDA